MESSQTLGNTANIVFTQFGEQPIQGKVDTGATTSSLDATDIQIKKDQNAVTFISSVLSKDSTKYITLPLAGMQEVHSADAGGLQRPTVSLDVSIEGVLLKSVIFNLNDRSNMDASVLIGQNILQAGDFIIDPSQELSNNTESTDIKSSLDFVKLLEDASKAQVTLKEFTQSLSYDIAVDDLLKALQTLAITNLTE
jgi:hypothetical protein